jgi:hypothetical protein
VKTKRKLGEIITAREKYIEGLKTETDQRKIKSLNLILMSADKQINLLTTRLKNYNEKLEGKSNNRGIQESPFSE